MEATAQSSAPLTLPSGISSPGSLTLKVIPVPTFLSTICVALRFLSRRITSTVGSDDWVCLAAQMSIFASFIATILNVVVARNGYSVDHYTPAQLTPIAKTSLAHVLFFQLCVALTKASILLFYKRIFAVTRRFSILIWSLLAIVAISFLSATCGNIFSHHPVHAQWQQWIPHTTINLIPFHMSTGIINSALDFIILLVPQFSVWQLQMTWKRKLLVSMLFMLGGCVCVVSILRFLSITGIKNNDRTISATVLAMWSLIEMNTGIICACLPLLHSLFRHWRGESITGDTGFISSSGPYAATISRGSRRRHPNSTTLQDSTEGLNRDFELVDHTSTANKKGLSVQVRTDIETHWESASSRSRAESL